MKPYLNQKIDHLKQLYKPSIISDWLCKELSISKKTYYRYLTDIKNIPVEKAIKLYLIIGLTPEELKIDCGHKETKLNAGLLNILIPQS